jgi:secreted protein with Ig-like and vWFA domain
VPTAGGADRAAVTRGAAAGGLGLFDDKWAVGVWLFSTELDGKKPYKQIVPISPLSSSRQKLQDSIEQIKPKKTGDTGLYDTLLAAYKSVQSGWDPYYVNSVILITDGRNDDANTLTLDQLVSSLQALMDPRYPIQVVIIGLFDDVSQAELQRITDITGGHPYIARKASDVGAIFLEALSERPPVPTT